MRMVIFSNDIKSIKLELPDDTLMIVHEMYDCPAIDCEVIAWQRFKATYADYSPSQFVIVGANRMINPSIRCDMVNDYLQVMTKSIPKVSIDTSPFLGEPWRLWYHYSLAFGEWLGVDYSYPVEGEWQKWFYYDQNDCKLKAENLNLFVKNTKSDLEKLGTSYAIYEPDRMLEEYYEYAKESVFEKYNTPKLLTNNLLKIMNKHLHLDFDMDSYLSGQSFKLPDFGVYRYVIEENKRRQSIYNYFAK